MAGPNRSDRASDQFEITKPAGVAPHGILMRARIDYAQGRCAVSEDRYHATMGACNQPALCRG
jgi:hypothetical protein